MHVNITYRVSNSVSLKNVKYKFVVRFILEHYGEKLTFVIAFLHCLGNFMYLKLNHIRYFVRLELFQETKDYVLFALYVSQN